MLATHPMTIRQMVEWGFFPSRKRARKRLSILVRRQQVYLLGTAKSIKRGRPEDVFARWRAKADNLRHEVLLTDGLMPYLRMGLSVKRGYEVDRGFWPDGELVFPAEFHHLAGFAEQDCGTMTYERIVRERFGKYRNCDVPVFWFEPSEIRLEGMRSRAQSISHCSFFATLDAIKGDPLGPVWIDYQLRRFTLEQIGAQYAI